MALLPVCWLAGVRCFRRFFCVGRSVGWFVGCPLPVLCVLLPLSLRQSCFPLSHLPTAQNQPFPRNHKCVCQWKSGCQIKSQLWQKKLTLRENLRVNIRSETKLLSSPWRLQSVCSWNIWSVVRCPALLLLLLETHLWKQNNRDKKQRKTGRRKTEWKDRKKIQQQKTCDPTFVALEAAPGRDAALWSAAVCCLQLAVHTSAQSAHSDTL